MGGRDEELAQPLLPTRGVQTNKLFKALAQTFESFKPQGFRVYSKVHGT